jgi:4-hydroxy-tetrahydrodipicolinate synthase
VLSVVPYYNKPMQDGISAHFNAIARSTGLPIILHDIPSRSVRELANDTLAELVESKRFVGLRDGTGDLARPLRLRSMVPPRFRLLSGDDAIALAYVTSGGDGCISMVSNVTPDLCRMIFSSCWQGQLRTARHLQKRLLPLEACFAGESPAALKYALSLLGLMGPATRLPLVELNEPAKAAVARAVVGIADENLVEVAEA